VGTVLNSGIAEIGFIKKGNIKLYPQRKNQTDALQKFGANQLVRAVGIEPTLLSERDFESRASTNSTTPAQRVSITSEIGDAMSKAVKFNFEEDWRVVR
jgi:hypothetical protein